MKISPRHEAALAYARAGVPVFICVPDGKEPATPFGFKDATRDEAQINRWFADGRDYNIAIEPEAAGWSVIDCDGDEGIGAAIASGFDPEATRCVRTPRGGLHLYYNGSLPSTVQRIAHKVDTRGRLGYVLVPPSIVNGKPYIEEGGAQADLPEWVAPLMAQVRKATVEARTDLDTPANIERAVAHLRGLVERGAVAVEGQGGDDFTYRTACTLVNLGLTAETAAELLDAHWNPHCQPPWDYDELEVKCHNASRYAQNEPGAWGATGTLGLTDAVAKIAEQMAAEEAREASDRKARYPAIRTAYAMRHEPFPAPEWLWEGRLLADEPNLYTGLPGAGKTTLAENVSVAVAAGVPLLGAKTMQADVFLLVAEDNYGPVRDNLLAIRQALDVDDRVLDRIHLLSVKHDRIQEGHILARITDDGTVTDTPFMREHIAPFLGQRAAAGSRVLFVVDPLAEFARFDHNSDDACRALATVWLSAVCRTGTPSDQCGLGRITALVNDHPSKGSVQTGFHYAGSVQLAAGFSFVATIKQGAADGFGAGRATPMEFDVLKGRYAENGAVKFLRLGKSPAYALDGLPGHTSADVALRVYEHVRERCEAGATTSPTNHGSNHGPVEIGHILGLSELQVKAALSVSLGRLWLVYREGAGTGGRDRKPARYELGSVTPLHKAASLVSASN